MIKDYLKLSARCLILAGAVILLRTDCRGAERIDYNRDIRPILSDRCFKCHGPDKSSRKGEFRLDLAEEALAERPKSHLRPIVPRKLEKSEVWKRINSTDADEVMPPLESKLGLTEAEKKLIQRWIAAGAQYQPHWAFLSVPERIPLPSVKKTKWVRNEIDSFVLDQLEKHSLKPSPEATRERWMRRVSYDLTGLPPTPDEAEEFLKDTSLMAYEKVVDRLLASKRYGERMAVPWLDAARYADSYGYQSDQMSPTWPYRDWVVTAWNDNMPFDKFLTEQIAGDLLPQPNRQQRLATAFNRLHRQTNEGGSIEEEWRQEYISDRIHTFGTTFLGLTFECTRCHDHKYDPLTMRDYYSLSSFFNNIDEAGLYNDTARVPTPSVLLPSPEQENAMDQTSELLRVKSDLANQAGVEAEGAFQDWLKRKAGDPMIPGLIAHFSLDDLKTNQFPNLVNSKNFSSGLTPNTWVDGKFGKSVQFTGDNELSFPEAGGSFQPWDRYSVTFWLELPVGLTNAVIFHRTEGTDVGFHGTELSLEQGNLFFVIKRFWPGNALAVRSIEALPLGKWVQIGVSYDGSGNAAGMALFINGQPARLVTVRDHLFKSPQNGGSGLSFGTRFRSFGLKQGKLDDLRVFSRPLAPVEFAHLFDGKTLTEELARNNEKALRPYYLTAVSTNVASANLARSDALRAYYQARDGVKETSVMEESLQDRPTYILARGSYDAPRTEDQRVVRATPAVLSPMAPKLPKNRLGLAQWMTDPKHPLTARVGMNRLWQLMFGKGLVTTTENFGLQGAQPTHPELLDWLARDYVRSGWDTKGALKRIVLSATYRQDSVFRPELKTKDPENVWLARGPTYRLPAEMIRDTALVASGLLWEERGGAPVSPYQPGDLWRESNSMSPAYQQSTGNNLYRRSLYTVWKRTAPMPNMQAFDAPSREVCVVKRSNTGTPQQALVLLNDVQFVESARVLAERTLKDGGTTVEARIEFAFRRLTGRKPTEREVRLLAELWEDQRKRFALEPERATRLVGVGAKKSEAPVNEVELAAATSVTQAIMNLDATVWKR